MVAASARASRTVNGGGTQPSRRPSRVTGGAPGYVASASATPVGAGTAPTPSTTARSASGAARSRRCSASSTVVPRSALRRATAASTSSAPWGSSCDVGSSRTSADGDAASAPAIATRWRSPPDSVVGARRRRCAMPSASSVSSTRRRIAVSERPRFSSTNAMSCSTSSTTSCASGSWLTNPTTSASSRGWWLRVERPKATTSPLNRPPVACGTRPFAARSSVLLPEPESPTTSRISPAATSRSTCSSAAGPSG